MPGHPGQVTSSPVSDAVPGELDHDEHQEGDLETDHPDHGVSAATGAHLLEVQVEDVTVTLVTHHVPGVLDEVAVLVEELLDGLDVVAAAGPGVAGHVIHVLLPPVQRMLQARFVQHRLQSCRVQLKCDVYQTRQIILCPNCLMKILKRA